MSGRKIVVTGAGGFIGHHLVKYLKKNLGAHVVGVDIKEPEYDTHADDFIVADLRDFQNCLKVMRGATQVYSLAADMGGMGFISGNHAQILYNNMMISFNTLEAARQNKVFDYFFSSSACIYPEYRQEVTDISPLKESDAYPAAPQDAYGWEKLMTERLCMHYNEDYHMNTHVLRFHNIFGPEGTWKGGREKAPAALCRKIAIAKILGKHEIEIWGDGEQTRSFCYIDDCVRGIVATMDSICHEPMNLGSDRMVSINELADIIAEIAEIEVVLKHVPGPQGVRGRNSDNEMISRTIGWKPQFTLEEGLTRTYHWIHNLVGRELVSSTDRMKTILELSTSTPINMWEMNK